MHVSIVVPGHFDASVWGNADELLHSAQGSVKLAIVMGALNVDREEASRRLKAADGFVRGAIENKILGSAN